MVRRPILLLALSWALAGCASSQVVDEGLEGLSLTDVQPGVVVEGTTIVITGSSFVAQAWGSSTLRLVGSFSDASGQHDIDVALPARFTDFEHMAVGVDAQVFGALGGEGDFSGQVTVEVVSAVDGKTYATDALDRTLQFSTILEPQLDQAQTGGLIFVNDAIEVQGADMLLGGNEGTTYAVVDGCFQPGGQGSCNPVASVEVPVVPDSPFDRTRGTFAFVPEIAGIEPGVFTGTVALRNRHDSGAAPTSSAADVSYELIEPAIFDASPTSASLGQYVDVTGGGFVGGEPGADTLLHLTGSFTPAGAPSGAPVDLELVPEFVEGRHVRYVISEDDALGQSLDLRSDTGTFVGTLTPVISYGGAQVTGSSTQMTLSIAPVKQVLYLNFLPTYVESLREFGLRAVDARIRQRVAEVVARDYATINLEVRTEKPDDFALYAQVDIAGPDPNGLGLFGYDNTPGKDVGNERLYDRIGGVNATTQQDGVPGYGGVFIESFFGFSKHPGGYAMSLSGAADSFDAIFDPFRPDRGGNRVDAADLTGGIPDIPDGTSCPAAKNDRADRIGCAIFVIGNLIGTTVSHETGHSLGLANPYGEGFHNPGDLPNRIMDSGGARPFTERAELDGDGPAVFCDSAYAYLREILPTGQAADPSPRPSCL